MNTQIIEQFHSNESIYAPFALTDVLLETAGSQKKAFWHFWQLEHTMILGMKDTRVNDLTAGINTILEKGYTPVIRNSGGLGVISDTGILNVSFITSKDDAGGTDTAYEKIYHWLQLAFPELTIDAYEISDSYCPGTYDLSVEGKKIAGTAQRRLKNGVATMMYLSVFGDQPFRGELVKAFYQKSLGEDFGTHGYPPVRPDSMINLADVLKREITFTEVKQRLLQAAGSLSDPIDSQLWLKEEQQEDLYQKRLLGMKSRNLIIEEHLHVNSL